MLPKIDKFQTQVLFASHPGIHQTKSLQLLLYLGKSTTDWIQSYEQYNYQASIQFGIFLAQYSNATNYNQGLQSFQNRYMIIIDHVDTTLTLISIQHASQGLWLTCYTQFFTTLFYSNTLAEIGEVVEKLLVLDYHHRQNIFHLNYSANMDTQNFNLVTKHGSLSSYDLVSHSCSRPHLAYVYITFTQFEGMIKHSTTLVRAYSSALIHYLTQLELDHVDHTTTTTFVKAKVIKVDLTVLGLIYYQMLHICFKYFNKQKFYFILFILK